MTHANHGCMEAESSDHSFPIRQAVCYTFRKQNRTKVSAAGETVYMSGREVGFTTETTLRPGQKVDMAVNWPVLLDRTCRLKLVICGHVMRNDSKMAVVRIEHYEFRTRGADPVWLPAQA